MIMRRGVGRLVRGGLRGIIILILMLILGELAMGIGVSMSMGMGLIGKLGMVRVRDMAMNKAMTRIYSRISTDKVPEMTISRDHAPQSTNIHPSIMAGKAIRRTRGERTRFSKHRRIDWDDTRARKVFRPISCCDLRRSDTMGIVL